MDRRVYFVVAVVVALAILSLFGLPPPVLWEKVKEFAASATGAAAATAEQSRQREKHATDATQVMNDMSSTKKDPPPLHRTRNQP